MITFFIQKLEQLPVLFAAGGRRSELGRRLQEQTSRLASEELMIGIGVLLAIVVASWFAYKWIEARRDRGFHSTSKLFTELCRCHGLSRAEKQLLHDIAAWHRMSNPSDLFIQADRFQTAGLLAALGRSEEIAQLAERLFEVP